MSDPADAAGQDWSAERYARNARFVAELGEPVVDWLDPKPGERVLDVGCGDGALTASIVARGAEVIGIDSSRSLIEVARARGIDARVIDAYALPFRAEFDAAFSNAALHWMLEPDLALAGIQRALVPRGRFVGEMGAQGNVAAISTAILAVLRARTGSTARRAGRGTSRRRPSTRSGSRRTASWCCAWSSFHARHRCPRECAAGSIPSRIPFSRA